MSSIPPFDEQGNLPPGVYWADWEEFKERFGTTLHRRRLIEGLTKAMEQLKAAGCRAIYINGSFVTDKLRSNNFDASAWVKTYFWQASACQNKNLITISDSKTHSKIIGNATRISLTIGNGTPMLVKL